MADIKKQHFSIKTVDGNRYDIKGQVPLGMKKLNRDWLYFTTDDGKTKYINAENIVSLTEWEEKD